MKTVLIVTVAVLSVIATSTKADLLDCEEKVLPSLSDIPGIGKIGSKEETHEVRDFFKKMGCEIKKGAAQVSEQAEKLGTEVKEGAKKLGEKAKDLGDNIKEKIGALQDRLTADASSEERTSHGLLRNVEIIDPDVLKAEQQCGHGHILDALGNCSKLRK